MTDSLITVSLPSLLHRLERTQVELAKQLSQEYHCTLKRVRRSRNWQLVGAAPNLLNFVEAFRHHAINERCFLCRKVDDVLSQHQDKLEPLEAKLIRLLKESPEMTLHQLMSQTRCSIAQARHARFIIEDE
ncbi:ribosome recycling factor family protein [Vibrio astriarenae]